MDCAELPTHVARVVSRLDVTGPHASGDTFLTASYVVESVLKTIGVVLCSGIRRTSSSAAYRFEYGLVRADGLGAWEEAITTAVGHSYAGYIDQDLQSLVVWLTRKRTRAEDRWAREAVQECSAILSLLAAPDAEPPRSFAVRYLLNQLVRVRNKTKAHGAVGADFFDKANQHYIRAAELILESCPAMGMVPLVSSTRPREREGDKALWH